MIGFPNKSTHVLAMVAIAILLVCLALGGGILDTGTTFFRLTVPRLLRADQSEGVLYIVGGVLALLKGAL
ncbi:hypothetical protein A7M48_20055 [Acinetobacter baumannii]|nr:hypothetical protein A7M48_20055 [Acinetobacter baumannii]